MPTFRISAPLALAAVAASLVLGPSAVQAQEPRLRISFAPGVATVGGDAALAIGGTFGYRFAERLWFEGDLSWFDAAAGGFRERRFDLDGRFDSAADMRDLLRRRAGIFGGTRPGGIRLPGLPNFPNGPIDIGRLRASSDGSTTVAMLGMRYELPVQTERFRPYLASGLGINRTAQELNLEATAFTPAISESVSHTGFAFNAGAGTSVRLGGRFWADVDARYLRLSRGRDIMRLGGGVSVRF